MQSGADDVMILETVKERYKNRTSTEFKRFHWWVAVRHQSKWRTRSDASFTMDAFVSSSEAATEEEVTRSIGHDRAKTVMQKGK
jgi:ribosomal protein L32E